MLGSADPQHIDQLPKRTDNGYECKSWAAAYVEFHPNSTYVLMIVDISLYAEWSAYSVCFYVLCVYGPSAWNKTDDNDDDDKNQVKFVCYCQFSMILGVGQICVNQAKNI